MTPSNAWARYANATYGFELYLDNGWKGYTTTIQPLSGVPGAIAIDFNRPDTDRANPQSEDYRVAFILLIVPTSKVGWNYMLPTGDPTQHGPLPTYLGRSVQYFFSYESSDDPPHIPNYDCEIRRVMGTFRLTN